MVIATPPKIASEADAHPPARTPKPGRAGRRPATGVGCRRRTRDGARSMAWMRSLPAALLLLLAAFCAAAAQPSTASVGAAPRADWTIGCVDCPRRFDALTDRSLRLLPDGRPALAYGGDHLYYAWREDAGWQFETADEAPAVGASASLAITASGEPAIAYYDAFNRDLKYARRSAGGWTQEVVDGAGDAGSTAALALDRAGRPHIAYHRDAGDGTAAMLAYARWDGSQWQLGKVADVALSARHISLALDSGDRPQISFYDTAAAALRFARWTGATWELITVDSDGDVGAGCSLALDAADRVHISYYDYDSTRGALRYATWDGVAGHSWERQVVDDADDVGGYTSIALDRAGRPAISYRDFTNGDLKLARGAAAAPSGDAYTPAAWQIETVDAAGDVGTYTSLALDNLDRPQIAYLDVDNSAIRHAAREGEAWRVGEVDRAGRVGEYTALAFDAIGQPHISYYDSGREQLKHATRLAGRWAAEVVDVGPGVGLYTSLAVDATGATHISYQDGRELDLKYARWSGTGWEIATVDAAGDVGASTSIAVDQAGRPHISYFDETNRAVKYATRGAAGWTIEVVETIGPLTYTALALDAAGAPHIAYYASAASGESGVLCYASRAAGGWQIKTVAAGADAGGHLSLALDAQDTPYLSYYDFTGRRVWAAQHGAAGWTTQVVATTGGESHTTLALDAAGTPLVAFYDSAAADLKFARPAAGAAGWTVTTIYAGGNAGAYPSLKLDAAGRPWISFYDALNGDLLIAAGAGGARSVFLPLLLRAPH